MGLCMGIRRQSQASGPKFFSVQVSQARRFYLDLKPSADKALSVVSAGYEHCTADYRIHRKSFPYYSIEFVARGRGTVTLNRQSHTLFPGRVFCYGPGISQQITTDAKDLLVKYFVDFAGCSAKELMEENGLTPGCAVKIAAPNDVLAIFDDLTANGLNGTRFSSRICDTILRHLILKIAESILPEGDTATSAFATYQKCREHIRDNLLNLKSLAQIAEQCNIDDAYLCRLFRRFEHQSPYKYLMRLKMNAAAELLKQPGVLVKEVAYQLGFKDPFHFSRSFKNVFGISPESFNRLR